MINATISVANITPLAEKFRLVQIQIKNNNRLGMVARLIILESIPIRWNREMNSNNPPSYLISQITITDIAGMMIPEISPRAIEFSDVSALILCN
jgi:hypothetical protein